MSRLVAILVSALFYYSSLTACPAKARDSVWDAYYHEGSFAYKKGDLDKAKRSFEKALQQAGKQGTSNRETALSLYQLGSIEKELGNYPASIQLFRKALDQQKLLLFPEHPDILQTLDALLQVCVLSGKTDQIESLTKEKLAIESKLFERSNPGAVKPASGVEGSEVISRDSPSVEDGIKNVVSMQTQSERVEKEASSEAQRYMDEGGRAFEHQRYSDAQHAYGRAISVLEKTCGANNEKLLPCLRELARTALASGDEAGLNACIRRTISIGRMHPHGAIELLRDVASQYREKQDYKQAESCLRQAIDLPSATAGDAQVANTYCDLGRVLLQQGRSQEAVSVFKTGLEFMKPNPDDQSVVSLLSWLGQAYVAQSKYSQQEEALKLAIAIKRKAPPDAELAGLLQTMCAVLGLNHKYAQADSYGMQALDMAVNNKQRADILITYAEMAMNSGNWVKAEKLLRQAVSLRHDRSDKEFLAKCYTYLSKACEMLGKKADSAYFKQQASLLRS